MTTKRPTAADRYIAHRQSILDMLDTLKQAALDLQAPDDDSRNIHWGHVGDLAEAMDRLKSVAPFLGIHTPGA